MGGGSLCGGGPLILEIRLCKSKQRKVVIFDQGLPETHRECLRIGHWKDGRQEPHRLKDASKSINSFPVACVKVSVLP